MATKERITLGEFRGNGREARLSRDTSVLIDGQMSDYKNDQIVYQAASVSWGLTRDLTDILRCTRIITVIIPRTIPAFVPARAKFNAELT